MIHPAAQVAGVIMVGLVVIVAILAHSTYLFDRYHPDLKDEE
jgi:hypothetical protein